MAVRPWDAQQQEDATYDNHQASDYAGGGVAALTCALLAVAVAVPVVGAAPAGVAPRVPACATWQVAASQSVSHSIGANTYTGMISLYKLVDATNGNAFCGQMYARATLTTPLGALSAKVRASLNYRVYGSDTTRSTVGSTITVNSGSTGTSSAYPAPGDNYNVRCGEAVGDWYWPDGQQTTLSASGLWCV